MSEIKYGLISKIDAECIEATLNYLMNDFPKEDLNIIEIGVFDGQTARGIRDYLFSKKRGICYHAIDNEKDKPILRPFEACNLIIGNSNEVYNRFEDNSQHLIIVDGNHAFPYVIGDYYCYESKVKRGGYLCFHDVKPGCQGLDWQRIGNESDPDMSISVRKALTKIGLLDATIAAQLGWVKVFEEWDENDRCGGICCFRKI